VRTPTEWTSSDPAAGKTVSTLVGADDPALARVAATAAAKPAQAKTMAMMRIRRLTKLRRKP
jgi:hypothetical protein